MTFAALLGSCAALGFSPREVDDMLLWEIGACVEGYNEANGGDGKPEAMSDEEFDNMLRVHGHA